MLSAITASTGRCDRVTTPRVERARVMLWAAVNAVTTCTSCRGRRTRNIRPTTNRMWSNPKSRCSTPRRRYAGTAIPPPALGRHRDARRLRAQEVIDGLAVDEAHAQQDVGEGAGQARDLYRRVPQPLRAAVDRPALEQGRRGQLGQGPARLAAVGRERRRERQPADQPRLGVGQHRLLPEHLEASRGHLRQLEVGGPHLVGREPGRERQCAQQRQHPAPRTTPPPRIGLHRRGSRSPPDGSGIRIS